MKILNILDEVDMQNLSIVNPIEFITKEENNNLMKNVLQRAKEINNPTIWMSCEDFEKQEKANGFI